MNHPHASATPESAEPETTTAARPPATRSSTGPSPASCAVTPGAAPRTGRGRRRTSTPADARAGDGHTDFDGEQLDLADRRALRRAAGLSTELTDVTEVEYRQLRLERVVLAGVWSSADSNRAEAEVSLQELSALAATAGSDVLAGRPAAPRDARRRDLPGLRQGGGARGPRRRGGRRHRHLRR